MRGVFPHQISVNELTAAQDGMVLTYKHATKNFELKSVDIPDAIPTGSISYFSADSEPDDFLECDGSSVSRTAYSALFGIIGTTFGSGDGSTTFNLPDLRGEFVRGWDHGRGIDSGRVFGSHQIGIVGAHNHPAGGHTHSVSAHSHSLSQSSIVNPVGSASVVVNNTTGQGGAGTTGGGSGNTRLNTEVEADTRPRNRALLPCIKY